MSLSDEDLDKMDFDYKQHLVFNYVMVDVDSKKNVSKVKDEIEDNIAAAKAIIKIEDTASYAQYQGEIDEGKPISVFSLAYSFLSLCYLLLLQ